MVQFPRPRLRTLPPATPSPSGPWSERSASLASRLRRTVSGIGVCRMQRRSRLPRTRGVAVLAALNRCPYVKVLIHIYIWQHCQDRQPLSLAVLLLDRGGLASQGDFAGRKSLL